MKSILGKETYKKIYESLDRVSPLESDCGKLCGAACCTCSSEPDETTPSSERDINADYSMGLYLLPGEDSMFDFTEDWIEWGYLQAEDYDFPDSWSGKVPFFQCKTPPVCPREKRPIQCRSFPLMPHIDEKGKLYLIFDNDNLPYSCPLIEKRDTYPLSDEFINATYSAWRILITDPYIFDLVEYDSRIREEEGWKVEVVFPKEDF